MFWRRLNNEFKYWFVFFPLIFCGFPKGSRSQAKGKPQYCSGYPYLYTESILDNDQEFTESLYSRHKTAKKIFSLSNITFTFLATYIYLFVFHLLLSFLITAAIYLNIIESTFGIISRIAFFFASMYLIPVRVFANFLYTKYSKFLCILESTFIYEDIKNSATLAENSSCDSILKQRIRNLSRLVKIHGKVSKVGRFHGMSMDISQKVDWLEDPIDSTLEDIKIYFKDFRYYWIVDKTGKIEVDSDLLLRQDNQRFINIINYINKTLESANTVLSILEEVKIIIKRIIKLFTFW